MDQPIKQPPAFCAPPTEEHRELLLELGMTPDAAQATIDIDTYMGNLRRSMARKELGRLALRDLQLGIDLTDLEIISMIEHGPGPDGEITVGLIAERLAIDPSRASRIVADAVDKGIIRRVASQSDARRIGLELTETGHSHAEAIRHYKWSAFAEALGAWPEEDLVTFARLFKRFSTAVSDTKANRAKP
jgi:DNA-binding MarR family transcriptional regulator